MRTIKLNDGKERAIHFDYNVIADVQDRYDDITLLTEKITKFKEIKWLAMEGINEGIAKRNHDIGTGDQPMTEFEVGLLMPLTKEKIRDIVNEIVSAFNDCMGTGKNVLAGDLTTQVSSTQEPTKATE